MVLDAIDRLQNGKAQDHDGLVGEHFSYARDTLALLIVHVFNRAICEGFPTSWTEHIIVPLFKSGDPMVPGNYRTIMIGHYLAKIYGSILELELSRLGREAWSSSTWTGWLQERIYYLGSHTDTLGTY